MSTPAQDAAESLANAEGMLKACADWHRKTGGTLDVKLSYSEAVAATDEFYRLRWELGDLTMRLTKTAERNTELAQANADLLHVLKVISGLWITETTPSSPPDALAERMAKLALAATLRKHP